MTTMIMMMMTKMISLTGLAMLFTCSIGPASSEASIVLQPGSVALLDHIYVENIRIYENVKY